MHVLRYVDTFIRNIRERAHLPLILPTLLSEGLLSRGDVAKMTTHARNGRMGMARACLIFATIGKSSHVGFTITNKILDCQPDLGKAL